jgi:hypothetical protein
MTPAETTWLTKRREVVNANMLAVEEAVEKVVVLSGQVSGRR